MTDIEYSVKLFEQLDELEQRYRRFMRAATVALAILFATNLWQVFVVAPAKSDQIQQSRQSSIHQFCEDEKTLVSIVPPNYPPLVDALRRNPDSALNPTRDCGDFVRKYVQP